MDALKKPEKFIKKFMKLVYDDIRAKQGVGYNSIGQYNDANQLIKLITPETDQAKRIFCQSLAAIG